MPTDEHFDYGRLPPPDVENIGLFDLKQKLSELGPAWGLTPADVDRQVAMLTSQKLTIEELRTALDDGDQDTRL